MTAAVAGTGVDSGAATPRPLFVPTNRVVALFVAIVREITDLQFTVADTFSVKGQLCRSSNPDFVGRRTVPSKLLSRGHQAITVARGSGV